MDSTDESPLYRHPADRAFRSRYRNVLRSGRCHRRLRARLDDADDRKRGVLQTQGAERGRGRRIARNHESANAPLDQRGSALQGIAHDGFRALGA